MGDPLPFTPPSPRAEVLVRHRAIGRDKFLRQRGLAPGAVAFADVSSRSPDPVLRALSPFHPCPGGVPVPGDGEGRRAGSVEGAWQGLKVFSGAAAGGADERMAFDLAARPRKRKAPSGESVVGHRLGGELLAYVEARKRLYVPMYEWTLRHCPDAARALRALRELRARRQVLVLLDFDTNADVEDATRPLSHASLVARALDWDA